MIEKILPYAAIFLGSLALTLMLVPPVRWLCKRLGMVDQPDARRINKVPIPRGGGLAIVVGLFVSYSIFLLVSGRPAMQSLSDATFWKMSVLSMAIAALGLLDDKFSLSPKMKLAGQLVIAVLVWSWAGIGFARLFPMLPAWLDCILTVAWIIGAVNAFNLIDGLDGLATGIAFIATIGIAGGVLFVQNPQQIFFYLALAGALAGFLRYNYNPASIFLGDCGSMFIGFMISTLPLSARESNSFFVSVGMPILAMGVPIFDTALAIVRRTIRKFHNRGNEDDGGVMQADKDHIHHRILRSVGMNQRRAAWTLYGITAFLVLVSFAGVFLDSKAGGLWLLVFSIGCVVVFRDLAKVELLEAGRLVDAAVHSDDEIINIRRIERLATVFYAVFDIVAVCASLYVCFRLLRVDFDMRLLRVVFPVYVFAVFSCLVFFRAYITVWARAMTVNYLRLLCACVFGSVFAAFVLYYSPVAVNVPPLRFSSLFTFVCFVAFLGVRFVRPVVREVVFLIGCMHLRNSKNAVRVLVYGAGLRYRAYRRDLVRSVVDNDRVVVGLLDDDRMLHGKYIGDVKVLGGIRQLPEVMAKTKADAIVVTCELSGKKHEIMQALVPAGVKITYFEIGENNRADRQKNDIL